MASYIGLDLGGTNIKAGVVDEAGNILSRGTGPTGADGGPTAVVENMGKLAAQVADAANIPLDTIDAVGIGAPGPLDFEAGTVKAAPNLPGWHNVPLRQLISDATGRPAVLENDANAAAFGEFWAGAGRGESIRDMVMLTLGTGIGSGLIVDRQLIHGAFGVGGEGGHVIVEPGGRQCGCGQRGCIEAYASATQVARRAVEAIEAGQPSSLRELHAAGQEITSREVFEAAAAGDALASEVVDKTARLLGVMCVNLCRLLDPQMIVFAGGMIAAGPTLFEPIREAFKNESWTLVPDRVQIAPAVLGNDAGFLGAAAVACDARRRGRA